MPTNRDSCRRCHSQDEANLSRMVRDSSPNPRPHRHYRSGSVADISRQHDSLDDYAHEHHHHSLPHNHQSFSHSHHNHSTDRKLRGPGGLARLSEHHSSHSLPSSRSNTLNVYPDQVSVLPDGGRRYLGADRRNMSSLGLHRDMLDNQSLYRSQSIYKNPNPLGLAGLNASRLSLHHSMGGMPNPESRHSDFFLPASRFPFNWKSKKRMLKLQTIMLVGCYSLLFLMAVIIGAVLIHQNGLLGGGPQNANILAENLPEADSPTNTGSRGKSRDSVNSPVPVHNVIRVQTPIDPNTKTAGVFGIGGTINNRPRSISGSVPGNRPVQNVNVPNFGTIQNNGINPHISSVGINPHISSVQGNTNMHGQQNLHIVPTATRVNLQSTVGQVYPSNTFMNNNNPVNGNNFVNNPNVQNQNFQNIPTNFGSNTNVPRPSQINTGRQQNNSPNTIHVHETIFLTDPTKPQNQNQGVPIQPVLSRVNSNNIPKIGTQRVQNFQQPHQTSPIHIVVPQVNRQSPQNINTNPTHYIVRAKPNAQKSVPLNDPSFNLKLEPSQDISQDETDIKIINVQPNKNKKSKQLNEKQIEKMKMLKEILDAEGSSKLLKDLITLKNNQKTLNAISKQTVSTISPPKQATEKPSQISPGILRGRDSSHDVSKSLSVTTKSPKLNVNSRSTTDINSKLPKKNNIQMVREILASLVNSPEVQQILNSRTKQNRLAGKEATTSRGQQVRSILLSALSKDIPLDKALQNLNSGSSGFSQRELNVGQHANKQGSTRQNNPVAKNTSQHRKVTPDDKSSPRNRVSPADARRILTLLAKRQNLPALRRTSRGRVFKALSNNKSLKRADEALKNRKSRSGVFQTDTTTLDNSESETTTVLSSELSKTTPKTVIGGEIVRQWNVMDKDGTMTKGSVSSDGSFAFTNCRPVEMCKDHKIPLMA